MGICPGSAEGGRFSGSTAVREATCGARGEHGCMKK
jgi:hypothetical protein